MNILNNHIFELRIKIELYEDHRSESVSTYGHSPEIKFNIRFLSNFHKLLSIVQCFELSNKKKRSPRPFTRYYRLKLPHNSLQFRLTNTCLFDQFTLLSVRRGSTRLK